MQATNSTTEVKVNPAYLPYLDDQSKVLLLYGGGGSGKSYFAAQKLIYRCITEPGHRFLVLRKVGVTVKNSVFQLLKEVINTWDLNGEFSINKTDRSFTHKEGSEIICMGMDDPEKIKSIQNISGMWLEEITEFTYDDFTQLLIRIRGEHHHYVQYIGSFNPISEHHWLKYKLLDNIDKLRGYTYLHTTYKNNLFLSERDKEQLEELAITNPLYYQVYCLGQWGVEDSSGKFAYEFSRAKHVHEGLSVDTSEILYLSFDFNINPITCLAIQYINGEILVLKAFKLANSNIYDLCSHIKATYPENLYLITGDATGRNSSALVRDKLNYYYVIKEQLDLADGQINVPSVNPPIEQNRILVNAVLRNSPVKIDAEEATGLIYDLTYGEVDGANKLKKDSRSNARQQLDSLDCFRYYLNTFHKGQMRSPKEILSYNNED